MPTALHDTIQSFCIAQFAKMYKRGFITEAEFELLSLNFGTDSFLPSGTGRVRKPHGAKKVSGVRKQADGSFKYGSDGTTFDSPAFPSLE